jgi:hypothetical protein
VIGLVDVRGELAEVDPDAVKGGVVPPSDDFVRPPFLRGGQQPIRPYGNSRPIVAAVEVPSGWVSYECLEASALIVVRKNKLAKRIKNDISLSHSHAPMADTHRSHCQD